MNKRGATQQTLFFIFEIAIAILIIFSLNSYIENKFKGQEFNKEFLVKDFGLTTDIITFSPNKIEMKYNISQEYIIENKNAKLSIKLKDLEIPKQYDFISKVDDFSMRSNEIIVKKDGKLIIR